MTSPPSDRRSGPVPESMSAAGLWVFESRHDEAFFMNATEHRFPKLLYIREGRGKIAADWPAGASDASHCVSGDCVLVPAQMPHRIVDDPRHPISLYGLALDPHRLAPCAGLDAMLPVGKLSQQRVSLLDIERRLRRLLYLVSQNRPATTLSAIAGAMELFAQLALASGTYGDTSAATQQTRDNSIRRDAIDEYLAWLDSNFFEPLCVDDAARACGMSRRKFTHDFRHKTGVTWLVYLNRRRIEHAKQLLRDTEAQVTSIAFQSGFEELSTFYRAFKRATELKPLDYRSRSGAAKPM